MGKAFARVVSVGLILALFDLTVLTAAEKADEKNAPADAKPVSLLTAERLLEKPELMVRTKLLAEIDQAQCRWEENYAKLTTTEQIAEYQRSRREFFFRQLGALWEKTPLNARVTATLTKDEYRAEKIVMETLPGFYATGTLFLPLESKFKPPYPGVLIVCGHSSNGKASELYQGICILGAMNGLAMYIQDPIDQGERLQHLQDGKPYLIGTAAHNLVGAGSILLGRNAATFEVWDMIRGLDFLQSRPEVIPDKLGVGGNSGGGTQTSYIMALDDRVQAAAPSCYLCNLFDNLTHKLGPQDAEQCIAGQIGFGMDHADYAIMRAPKPTLLCTKTKDFFFIEDTWKSYRFINRIYSRFRSAENLSIIEVDGEHGYCPELLEASIRWFLRHLAGRDERIQCPDRLPILTEEEIKSLPNGVLALDGARTAYDLNRDLSAELAARRKEKLSAISADDFAAVVRNGAGIRPFDEIPAAKSIDTKNDSGDQILQTEEKIYLPVRVQDATGDRLLLVVTERGRRSESAERFFAERKPDDGFSIRCVELRGWGETQNVGAQYYQHNWFGTDGVDAVYAYLLGRSFIAMRTEDLLATAKFLKETTGKRISLAADGPSAGIVVLHAAAAAPGFFESVEVPDDIPTWSSLVDASPTPIRLTDTIHGVLNHYDIDDLRRLVLSAK